MQERIFKQFPEQKYIYPVLRAYHLLRNIHNFPVNGLERVLGSKIACKRDNKVNDHRIINIYH